MKTYMPQRILVTGGAGFIGSHYVDFMHDTYPNVEIVTLDALTYAGNKQNLAGVENSPRHTFVHGNILDKALVQNLLEKHNIDTIVHFAAESHVDRSISGPSIFVETNIVGTQCLLEVAREYWLNKKKLGPNQCRFHMISTDEVYGTLELEDPAFTEKNPYAPNSPYAASKASADHLVRAYATTFGLPITLSNCSNNYGPRQHNEKLIPTVMRACIEERAIPVYGTGLNRRDWIHVLDHCAMVDWVIRSGRLGESYNLGADCELTNLEIIKIICGLMDNLRPERQPHSQLISFVPDRAGHDFRYAINSAKALAEGCVKPKYTLSSALNEMLTKQFLEDIEVRNKVG
jgi:dTDP-glucose 4,6-dehydratase